MCIRAAMNNVQTDNPLARIVSTFGLDVENKLEQTNALKYNNRHADNAALIALMITMKLTVIAIKGDALILTTK